MASRNRAPSEIFSINIRGLRYNFRRWGNPDAPPILCLHGTQDSSITFQFLVENLTLNWCVIAPDWRGHGYSDWAEGGYWLHEFIADLDVLIEALFEGIPIPVVGHSMGGNIAGLFAGLRPKKISHFVSLDGFGPLLNTVPVNIHSHLKNYLDRLGHQRKHKGYESVEEMATRLIMVNGRLAQDYAMFLAKNSSTVGDNGLHKWLFDPNHRATLSTLHSIQEWMDIWMQVSAPTLWIASGDFRNAAPANNSEEMRRRRATISGAEFMQLSQTGHNLHHDAPELVANAIEQFLTKSG